ncbi:hypothetical protein MHBO_003139 [Bonamia ostreae]|uniref:Gamma tubulin complex component C-terminal domain-containing protein n=1 Tax=Bonamia ostreae TaxID=126728 RepID=A0ABV2APK3_9EUKA
MFKNSNSVKAEALDPLIQKSLLTHLYTNDKKEIQNEFNLRFFKLQNKDSITVLDIFCFTYDLNPKNPLKIIFDDSSLSKYKTIFNFLWKFKFAQKLMSAQFAINSEISKRFLSFKGPKTEKINGANTILSKFVFNATILLNRISKLLFYGAVETSCKNFLTKCKTVHSNLINLTTIKFNQMAF